MVALEGLGLGANEVGDVAVLTELDRLYWLNLIDNDVTDISPLSELDQLGWLNLYRNPLDDDSVLVHIPNMEARGVHVVY